MSLECLELLLLQFLQKRSAVKKIPFEVSVDPFYSKENMERLRRSIAQMEKTGGKIHEVDTA